MYSFTPEYRGKDYLEQWERVKRWYVKVQGVKNNSYSSLDIKEQEDYLYIYFLNLFHLKDWVKNFTSDSEIEGIFDKDTGVKCLKVCADFATNHKHFQNLRNPRLDGDTYFISRDAHASIGPFKTGAPAHVWWINSNGERLNVYSLAEDCFNEVEIFLKEKKLI